MIKLFKLAIISMVLLWSMNWGLIGVFEFNDMYTSIFGNLAIITRLLVGLSALITTITIYICFSTRKEEG